MFAIWYIRNYFLLLHIFQTTSVNEKWGQPWLIQPQSFPKQVSGWICFFAETFRSFFVETFWSLIHFGHLSHSCIKTHHNSVFSLYIQTLRPKWLNFFRPFQRRFSVWPKKNRFECFCMLCSCNWKDEIWNKFSILNLLGCCLWIHGF